MLQMMGFELGSSGLEWKCSATAATHLFMRIFIFKHYVDDCPGRKNWSYE